MTDRLYIAAEVTRRLNYIQRDTWELARLLRGEKLSPGFHESLRAIIDDLERLADAVDPAAKRDDAAPARQDKVDVA
jgi:hypothetical protein